VVVALLAGQAVELEKALDVVLLHGPAVGAAGEALDHLAGGLLFLAVGLRDHEPVVRRRVLRRLRRAGHLDVLDRHGGERLRIGLRVRFRIGLGVEDGGDAVVAGLDAVGELEARQRGFLNSKVFTTLSSILTTSLKGLPSVFWRTGPHGESVLGGLEGVEVAERLAAGRDGVGAVDPLAQARQGEQLGVVEAPAIGRLGRQHLEHLARDRLGGVEVLFEQERRQREDVADVVEAIADVVGGEVVGGLHLHAEQIAHGVVVLDAIEPPQREPAGVALLRAVGSAKLLVEE